MKYLIGFFLGMMVAGAVAQTVPDFYVNKLDAVVMAGRGPDGHAAVINVDAQGHVICSKE